jgi:osomolarity two-component system response regulator SKN7
MLPDSGDEPAPELRRARETLLNVASAVDSPNFGKELERLSLAFQNVSSPPESTTSSAAIFPQQNLSISMPMPGDPFTDMKHLVYPMGQNQGIDPFHADHIHNIPYTQPPMSQAMEATSQITPPPQGANSTSIWAKRPYILLVEDDKVCARIGAKFLVQYGCQVDTAVGSSSLRSRP